MTTQPATTDNARGQFDPDIPIRWSMCLVEPLLSIRERLAVDDELARNLTVAPRQVTTFLGGTLSDVLATLPADDPWRQMSATLQTRCGDTLRRGQHPPTRTGASLHGAPFATHEVAADMNAAVFEDPRIDIATAALVEPLEPLAAALLAFGFDGWQPATTAAYTSYRSVLPTRAPLAGMDRTTHDRHVLTAARRYITAATQALRWAVHRRKSYVGPDDPFILEAAWGWAMRGNRVVRGGDWARQDRVLTIAAAHIAPIATGDEPTHHDDSN